MTSGIIRGPAQAAQAMKLGPSRALAMVEYENTASL
jgi:hypothetical protein